MEIRVGQVAMQNTLSELVHQLRSGVLTTRSPSTYPFQQSPSMASPSVSTPTTHQHASPQSVSTTYTSSQARPARASLPGPTYQSPPVHSTKSVPSEELHPPQLSTAYANMPPGGQNFNTQPHPQPSPVLPPFSSIQTMGPPVSQRYQSSDPISQRVPGNYPPSGSKRHVPPSSNVTSADSSDLEDEDNGELPAQGLVAPWEVLRGLADVVSERAAKVRRLLIYLFYNFPMSTRH